MTLCTKAEIIRKPDKHQKLINLVKEYDVGRAMIYDIRKNRENIKYFMKNTTAAPVTGRL
jgi:hypothetical protein